MQVAFVGPMLSARAGLVPNPAESLAPLLIEDGVRCRLVSSQPGRLLRAVDTAQTLMRWAPDLSMAVIIIYSGLAFHQSRLAALVLRSRGVPYSLYLKGGGLPDFARTHRRAVARLFQSGRSVIAPSSYLARLANELQCDTEVIPNVFPIEATLFTERRALRPRILWLRAFHRTYDPMLAVRTLASLRSQGIEATMTMAGGDKGELAATRRLIDDLQLAHAISLVGFADAAAKAALFKAHDLFLHTSRIDNTPVSVFEAMASGLPVVGTDVGGMADFVDGRARLVPLDRPDLAAEALRHFLKDPSAAQRASQQGRELVERHTRDQVLPLWHAHFERHGRTRG